MKGVRMQVGDTGEKNRALQRVGGFALFVGTVCEGLVSMPASLFSSVKEL